MTPPRLRNPVAFTIIELLVVIGIIAVVAGLVVGLAGVAGEKSKLSRAQAERDRLVTYINSYQSKLGFYPPDNPANPAANSLLYELAGAIRDTNNTANDPTYITPFGNVKASDLLARFGVNGVANSADIFGETNSIQRFMKDLRPDQTNRLVSGVVSLVVPIDGPTGQQPTPWQYLRGDNATNNKASFDLWVDIKVRGKMNRIGNWRN